MHPYAFYSMGISDRRTSIALTWNAMTFRQQNTDSSRDSFTHTTRRGWRCSDPQGMDNLCNAAGRGLRPASSMFGRQLKLIISPAVGFVMTSTQEHNSLRR